MATELDGTDKLHANEERVGYRPLSIGKVS